MFPLEVSRVQKCALIVKTSNTGLCHLRYGHMNVKALKLLGQKNMDIGLPKIDDLEFCEGCVYGKQNRVSLPINKAWKASSCLDLVHTYVCGSMIIESLVGSQ